MDLMVSSLPISEMTASGFEEDHYSGNQTDCIVSTFSL